MKQREFAYIEGPKCNIVFLIKSNIHNTFGTKYEAKYERQ